MGKSLKIISHKRNQVAKEYNLCDSIYIQNKNKKTCYNEIGGGRGHLFMRNEGILFADRYVLYFNWSSC